MEILPYPWNKMSYHILKHISCEGRLSIIYDYQFRLLHELRFGKEIRIDRRLNVPCFLLQSIIDTSMKIQEGKHQQLAHHGLLKLILEDDLSQLRIPIQWSTFKYMEKEVAIEIQALEYDRENNSSVEEEAKENEEKPEEEEEELKEEQEAEIEKK